MSTAVVPVEKQLEKKAASWAQTFVDHARTQIANAAPAGLGPYADAAGSVASEYIASSATGAALGAAHAKWGLDSKRGPLDGFVAVAGAVASVALCVWAPGAAAHARHVGASAATVLAFRRSCELVSHQPIPSGAALTGAPRIQRIAAPGASANVPGEDPIERVARTLGG
jgi:hypothetical protein